MTNTDSNTISVLGAGAWGTTLAILLARNHHRVRLWGHDAHHMHILAQQRINTEYLPDFPFPDALEVTADLREAVSAGTVLLVAVPSAGFRGLLEQLARYIQPGARLAWATKGLEPRTGRLLHQVVGELLSWVETAVISGPTFAREVAAGLPTAVTVASDSGAFATQLAQWLHNARFRAYTSSDLIGVQLGGAVKNVLAVAAGIADGLGYGSNTRAALVTRGLAEMTRLGLAMGGHRDTFSGLAGLGDLLLTCTDDQSRNRRFGLHLGQGKSVAAAMENVGQLVEGLPTTREVHRLAVEMETEMPITEQVYRVLYEDRPPPDAVDDLLNRQLRSEEQ